MKHYLRQALLLAGLLAAGCRKDDEPKTSTNDRVKYLVSTTVYGNSSATGFLVPLGNLQAGSISNQNAPEITSNTGIVTYKDWAFTVPAFRGATIKKFVRGDNGSLMPGGELVASSLASAGPFGLVVLNDTKAYVTLAFTNRIVVFNPSTMTKISEIDLSSPQYASGGASGCNPFSLGLRGTQLFVSCANFIAPPVAASGAHLLLIDTNTDQVVKSIDDARASLAGRLSNRAAFQVDEQGDMYIYCWASYGYAPGQKHGFLRIKKDATEFDPGYFFNCTDYAVAGEQGGKLDYFQRIAYGGNGVFYATAHNPSYDSNPPQYLTDRSLGAAKVNVYTQTMESLPVPRSISQGAAVGFAEGKALFGGVTAVGTGLFFYDPSTNRASTTPDIIITGGPDDIAVFD